MKQRRKEELLHAFPAVPDHLLQQMNGKKRDNYAVMLRSLLGDELFVRCYHRYSNGTLVERQRYVFAKDGCFRAGSDDGRHWTIRRDFREPVFCKSNYGYSFDNGYHLLNQKCYKQTCMKYSQLDSYTGSVPMEYLHLYCKHPNLEYLMKSGYTTVIDDHYTGWWGTHLTMYVDPHINWSSNNLLHMLGLSRTEFKVLRGKEHLWSEFIAWRERYPKCSPEEHLYMADKLGWNHGTVTTITEQTGLNPVRAARYLEAQHIEARDYLDYIRQCMTLQYDLHDTAISMPHHFMDAHTRLTDIIKERENAALCGTFAEHIPERERLEFAQDSLLIRQPQSMGEIIREGRSLHHCVGGYASRHAEGVLHILFIRKVDEPDTPYFTMELSTEGKVVQVRGLKNCDPPKAVKAFVEEYKKYILPLFAKRQEREKVRITA